MSALEERLPSFFVIGAAKCGTTTLYDLLSTHPEVFVPVVKEPQFFSNDAHFATGIESYAKTHYSRATQRTRGDFTPHYLLWEKAALRIRSLVPESGHRFIVILRDPVERAYSLYWNMVAEGIEPLSFEKALEAEPERASDPALERAGAIRFLYVAGSLYGAQLECWLRHFPRERFLVLRLDELQRRRDETLRRVCAFIGVSTNYTPAARGSSNPAGMPRLRALHRFLRQPHWIKEPLKALLPHEQRQRLIARLFAWNRREVAYPPIDGRIATSLRERFAPDVEKLGLLSGLDVHDWLPR